MSEPLVIVGNGMAAACLCEELVQRAIGRYAVSVIREERLAYDRVLLSSNTVSQNMFLNIFFVRHNSTAAVDLSFAIQANDRESFVSVFVSRINAVASQKEYYNVTEDHDRLS
ncbi:hypothetical protein AYJ54_41190 [Bradyrhizobium centrolobii]|uniref:FAD/NAD(P)-binding domain-containing protein n=1 Tax=Bradyrhizobium centrolobii TaxID=1505087 RepID=A0A176Z2T4_9BRAD|nr:hypothetical protein AYJ54_41190 [Bradyrhizobium centrolobii]